MADEAQSNLSPTAKKVNPHLKRIYQAMRSEKIGVQNEYKEEIKNAIK